MHFCDWFLIILISNFLLHYLIESFKSTAYCERRQVFTQESGYLVEKNLSAVFRLIQFPPGLLQILFKLIRIRKSDKKIIPLLVMS